MPARSITATFRSPNPSNVFTVSPVDSPGLEEVRSTVVSAPVTRSIDARRSVDHPGRELSRSRSTWLIRTRRLQQPQLEVHPNADSRTSSCDDTNRGCSRQRLSPTERSSSWRAHPTNRAGVGADLRLQISSCRRVSAHHGDIVPREREQQLIRTTSWRRDREGRRETLRWRSAERWCVAKVVRTISYRSSTPTDCRRRSPARRSGTAIAAAEGCVALRVDRLVEFEAWARRKAKLSPHVMPVDR